MKVFLTGGSSGIGAEFYKHLINNSYKVDAPTRTNLDLSNFNIDDVNLADYDYLILCAGVDTNGRQPFINLNANDFVNTINVNLLANMKLIHKYIKQRGSNWSKIIIVSSTITDYVWQNFVAYGTSKVALEVFVKSLELELDKSIGFSIIRPGLTKTNFHFNRGNVDIKDKNILYDTKPHMLPIDFISIFNEILNDRKHLLKEITLSS